MRIFRPGFLMRRFYSGAIFRTGTKEKVLCLTFDDGPDPVSTPKILEVLAGQNVRAIFFCTGSAAEKYPELTGHIRSGGHLIGNHGYRHADGWRTSCKSYIENVIRAGPFTSDRLFRPPYGHLTPAQYSSLKESFKIVFWDIMPYDYDDRFGAMNSLRILVRLIRPGAVIALHDKHNSSAPFFLDKFIDLAAAAGYSFALPDLVM
ncbi:MAG TPA: polysaccharide deacetylase family protein [Bacteroidales bacterium]|nr:polysaccharide deacetylase family protein [Bacteroidales bacterium]